MALRRDAKIRWSVLTTEMGRRLAGVSAEHRIALLDNRITPGSVGLKLSFRIFQGSRAG